jgi:transcriptional regulator with XRE-family HTH domain
MDLATILKVPQQSISSWERGDTEPTKAGMESLVRFFGIQEDAFRTGIGFEIPKLPSAGFLGWMAGEDSLAVEEGSLRVLSLPSAGPGEAWEVDAATGRRNPLTKEQALELVGKAFDQKDVVWVVVKPHDENQPVLNTI